MRLFLNISGHFTPPPGLNRVNDAYGGINYPSCYGEILGQTIWFQFDGTPTLLNESKNRRARLPADWAGAYASWQHCVRVDRVFGYQPLYYNPGLYKSLPLHIMYSPDDLKITALCFFFLYLRIFYFFLLSVSIYGFTMPEDSFPER